MSTDRINLDIHRILTLLPHRYPFLLVDRVLEGAATYRIALMCAEKEPLECHRTLLVARELARRGVRIRHILIDGTLESHEEAMARLVKQLRLPAVDDLFSEGSAVLDQAYERQSARIAWQRPSPQTPEK